MSVLAQDLRYGFRMFKKSPGFTAVTIAVLAHLRSEHYGYTLRKTLNEHGLTIDESTLYPLLRRLESQGLLTSQWREEDKRNKRFYRLSPDGEATLEQLLGEWDGIDRSIRAVLKEHGHGSRRTLSASR